MRKGKWLGILLLFVFAACKKDGGDTSSYMYMDFADASHVSFGDSALTATKNTNGFALQINAYSNINENVRIALNNMDTGTYMARTDSTNGEKRIYYFAVNRRLSENGNVFTQSGILSGNVTVPMTLTITAINSGYVEGYFSGNLDNVVGTGEIAISNGKFKISF